jgi:hypothetical protein
LAALDQFRDTIETLPTMRPSALDLTLQFWAVAIGHDHDRSLFVRRTNPRVSYAAGRFLAVGRDRLQRIEDPAFSFDARFDFIMGHGWVAIVNQRGFEVLFRTLGVVEENINAWIQGITDHLPMAPASVEALRTVGLQDSRTWRRLREIKERGHLAGVSLDDVRTYACAVGLEPNSVVSEGQLVFHPADRFSILHLLNEDLYRGQLTNERFEAQRKARSMD